MLICIGDSNTYGYDPTNFWGEPYSMPWPLCLERIIGEPVLNFGENGAEIPHRERDFYWLERRISKTDSARFVTVMLGSNDLMLTGGDVKRIRMRMEELIAFLKGKMPNAGFLLLAPPHFAGMEAYLNPACRELSEEYRKIAEQNGLLFADPKEWGLQLGADGVHLTESAHLIFAEKIAEILVKS